jgi:uncharacterized protein YcaQ
MEVATLDTRRARRLALARAGLLVPRWTGLPAAASGSGKRARDAANSIVERFGYLQLDTVSVAGARSHSLVLLSRLEGLDPELGECLLQPGAALFEYWGHEACWMPLDLYSAFEFRRHALRDCPWRGRALREQRGAADALIERVRRDGPVRSLDLEGDGGSGWWSFKEAKWILNSLWSVGEIAIRERRRFQRTYDLPERVLPPAVLEQRVDERSAMRTLLMRALGGHGWATTGTLAATWRLVNLRHEIRRALDDLASAGEIVPTRLRLDGRKGHFVSGWVRPQDLELAERLAGLRPRSRRAVLLSPFDPVLWDRTRVEQLFGFHQILEIFKPAAQRRYGYFCMPVLAGDRLVARCDLKAHRREGRLEVLSRHVEPRHRRVADEALRIAVRRYADQIGLQPEGL